MRILQILTLFLITGYLHSAPKILTGTSSCRFEEGIARNGFLSTVQGQQIAVIGWYHGTTERDEATKTLISALKMAKQNKCDLVKKEIDKTLGKYRQQLIESRRVLEELENLDRKAPFKMIGLEYTPNQYKNLFVDPETGEDYSLNFLKKFEKLCPLIKKKFQDLITVFPGPEFEYARKSEGRIRVVAMGDDDIINKAFNGYSEESRNFVKNLDNMSSKAIQVYEQLGSILKKSDGNITDKQIEDLISKLPENEKSKFEKYLNEIKFVNSLNDKRNKLFVEQIVKTKEPTTLVVGNFHVSGIRKELANRCK